MKSFVRFILVFLFLTFNCMSASAIIVFSENDYGCGWRNSGDNNEITTQNSFEIGINIASFLLDNSSSISIMQLKHSGNWDRHPESMINIANEVSAKLGITVTTGDAELGVTDLSNVKMLFMTGHNTFSITNSQKTILKEFIDAGGLLFGDDCNQDAATPSGFESSFRQLVNDLYGKSLVILPSDHPIYSSYYELDGNDFSYTQEGNGTQWGIKPIEFFDPKTDNDLCSNNDSDNDGVIDSWDKCLNTPTNSFVDKTGCKAKGLYTEEQMNQMVSSILSWGDLNGDNRISLIEAIKALRVTSGVTEPIVK